MDHQVPVAVANTGRGFVGARIRCVLDLITFPDFATATGVESDGPVLFAHGGVMIEGTLWPIKGGNN